jgi:hypothetical protein
LTCKEAREYTPNDTSRSKACLLSLFVVAPSVRKDRLNVHSPIRFYASLPALTKSTDGFYPWPCKKVEKMSPLRGTFVRKSEISPSKRLNILPIILAAVSLLLLRGSDYPVIRSGPIAA